MAVLADVPVKHSGSGHPPRDVYPGVNDMTAGDSAKGHPSEDIVS